MNTQKIVLSTNHEHGWASEYPREFQEFFLMHPDIIRHVEAGEWDKLKDLVTRYWTAARSGDTQYLYWPVCLDAIPDLKIEEVPLGEQFILNEVPYEHIVILNGHNVITADY